MKRLTVAAAYPVLCALAAVGVGAAGLQLGLPLTGVALTVVLLACIAAVPWAPVPASCVFAVAFAVAVVTPGHFGVIDALLAPVLCGVLAYRRPLAHALAITAVLAVAGLWDSVAGGFTTEPVPIVVWIGQLIIGVAIGKIVRERQLSKIAMRQDYERRRSELARTLHDSVAASLTSVVIRAEVLALAKEDVDDDLARELRGIADASRTSMRQVRQLITVLDNEEKETVDTSLASLSAVLDGARERLVDHGFRVRLDATPPAVVLSPASVALVERFVGEVVTNVVKYAPSGATVEVTHRYDQGNFEVALDNPLSEGRRPEADLSSGFGLAALRDEAERAGGKLTAGSDGQRWLTKLELPA